VRAFRRTGGTRGLGRGRVVEGRDGGRGGGRRRRGREESKSTATTTSTSLDCCWHWRHCTHGELALVCPASKSNVPYPSTINSIGYLKIIVDLEITN
jgi:hypothetical protein